MVPDSSSISPDSILYNPVYSWAHVLSRGLLGIVILVLIAYLLSENRKAISWKLVVTGLIFQFGLALAVLHVPFVQDVFGWLGAIFVVLLDFTKAGSEFLFSGFLNTKTYGFIFAFQVLPTIIFFAALTNLLFYLGVVQKIVHVLAWLLVKALKISGAESLSVAGNIFIGQTESPLMIKAYLPSMTRSELFLVMVGGMATLAGGVLAAYISFLGGDDYQSRLFFARHLLTASVMAAPGAVVVAKMLVPQTSSFDQGMEFTKGEFGSNVLDSVARGTFEGLKLAVNVGAMLLVFIAFIAMFNFITGKVGEVAGINEWIAKFSGGQHEKLSLQFILGYAFSPLMWVIGVHGQDITLLGRLLGEKIILTEFIGYVSLAELKDAGAFAQQRSIVIATYMLCGFANVASIGIQIAGIGYLAHGKRVLITELGFKALMAGTITSLLSASMIGMIITG
jgi:concentrative nucleoside transporter, CNT family